MSISTFVLNLIDEFLNIDQSNSNQSYMQTKNTSYIENRNIHLRKYRESKLIIIHVVVDLVPVESEGFEKVICPDPRFHCPDQMTCCKTFDGDYACCEYPFPTITFFAQLERRKQVSLFTHILPCVIINTIGKYNN